MIKVEEKKKMGRPTDSPKVLNTRVRLSQEEIDMLNYCSEKSGKTKAEIIRLGVKKVYDELSK